MVQVSRLITSHDSVNRVRLGPLVDDGAPYSAIRYVELLILRNALGLEVDFVLDKLPESLDGRTLWQYGSGKHASETRRIMGSIALTAKSNCGWSVAIRHLVLDGSRQ